MTTTPYAFEDTVCLVVAAGRGTRAGDGLPKQYRPVAGKMLLTRTLESLSRHLPPAQIRCVIHPDDMTLFETASAGLELGAPIMGGATRQESVANGLAALAPLPKHVWVHDGARPFLTAALLKRLHDALTTGAAAVIPATAVTDTIKRVEGAKITATVDRSRLRAVQTPQAFQTAQLIAAHEKARSLSLTDDAAVMEAAGHIVQWVEGDTANVKLTVAEDFVRAEQALMADLGDIRVGSGYDVHRLVPGDHVWLGGIRIPHTESLKGHSDADVGLHALTDAILAALSDGDIGAHFPPTDSRWRGEPSDTFLSFAAARVRARGGMIAQLSLILICEAPKIGPHREAIRHRIADISRVDVDRISVQATTTEKLGFAGRGEGIAAQATATVRLPLKGTP